MKTPLTTKEIQADQRVHSIERNPGMDDYTVMIYLADGFRAEDGTGTLYGKTTREAAAKLRGVTVGDPD